MGLQTMVYQKRLSNIYLNQFTVGVDLQSIITVLSIVKFQGRITGGRQSDEHSLCLHARVNMRMEQAFLFEGEHIVFSADATNNIVVGGEGVTLLHSPSCELKDTN